MSDHPGVQQLLDELGLSLPVARFRPSYNVPPTSLLWSAVQGPELLECHWGLVPPWARPGRFTAPLINARSESAWDKPSFRKLIAGSRAVVPINGFYEWRRQGSRKSAFAIRPAKGGGFALAGLYQVSRDGEPQICVLTTAANAAMQAVHDRMPVILPPGHLADWLNASDRGDIDAYLQPAPDEWLDIRPVGDYVNDARHDGPECLAPAAGSQPPAEPEQPSLLDELPPLRRKP